MENLVEKKGEFEMAHTKARLEEKEDELREANRVSEFVKSEFDFSDLLYKGGENGDQSVLYKCIKYKPGPGIGEFTCEYKSETTNSCKFKTHDFEDMVLHCERKLHVKGPVFKCTHRNKSKCFKLFKSLQDRKSHVQNTHELPRMYNIDKINKSKP